MVKVNRSSTEIGIGLGSLLTLKDDLRIDVKSCN